MRHSDPLERTLTYERINSTGDIPRIPFPDAWKLFTAGPNLSDPNAQIDLTNWNSHQPYTMQYNLTIQRQLWPNASLALGYMGSQSRNNSRNE